MEGKVSDMSALHLYLSTLYLMYVFREGHGSRAAEDPVSTEERKESS